jgi:hypothetical protein
MIDFRNERLILLRDFARHLPESPTYQTVWGWATRGRRRADGELVYLETVRIPAGRCTTLEAYWRFLVALSEGDD